MTHSITDFGVLSNLNITPDHNQPDSVILSGYDRDGQRVAITVTDGILRSMWAHLTQLLYPHAADTLTHLAETARAKRSTLTDSAYLAAVTYHTANGLIEMRGVSAARYWIVRFSASEGYELWAKLEDQIDNG